MYQKSFWGIFQHVLHQIGRFVELQKGVVLEILNSDGVKHCNITTDRRGNLREMFNPSINFHHECGDESAQRAT